MVLAVELRRFGLEEDTMGRQKRVGGGGRGVHAAICLKEGGGSISNFGSKEGQLKHGEVIIYCSSTPVMEDSSGIREAFTSAGLLSASSRKERPSGALLHLYYSCGGFSDSPPSLPWRQLSGVVAEMSANIVFFLSLIGSDQQSV